MTDALPCITEEAKRSGCPAMLSKYLGTKRSYNKKRAEQTEDVLETTRLLIKRYSNTSCYSVTGESAYGSTFDTGVCQEV